MVVGVAIIGVSAVVGVRGGTASRGASHAPSPRADLAAMPEPGS